MPGVAEKTAGEEDEEEVRAYPPTSSLRFCGAEEEYETDAGGNDWPCHPDLDGGANVFAEPYEGNGQKGSDDSKGGVAAALWSGARYGGIFARVFPQLDGREKIL